MLPLYLSFPSLYSATFSLSVHLSSHCLSQLLALFRFLCLQLGYAAVRLRHWWVIAVRHGTHTHTHTHIYTYILQMLTQISIKFNHMTSRLYTTWNCILVIPVRLQSFLCSFSLFGFSLQITTLVTSAFLVVKVVLSEVSSSIFPLCVCVCVRVFYVFAKDNVEERCDVLEYLTVVVNNRRC